MKCQLGILLVVAEGLRLRFCSLYEFRIESENNEHID